MPELDPQTQAVLNSISEKITALTVRLDALTTRLATVERVAKACAVGLKETEKETGSSLMPEGDYYGIRFN